MRKLSALLIVLLLLAVSVLPVMAEEGSVIYSGSAREFIFEPGSEYSPTDLFPNYKGVMPGDSLSQMITIRNDRSRVKIRVYMRALGAHEASEEFLSQLHLRVNEVGDSELFDAPANETAQLTDWVYLGTLYAGGEIDLEVILDVPVELDNRFSNAIGYLDWEFLVEEHPEGGVRPPTPGGEEPPEEPIPPEGEMPLPPEELPDLPYTGDSNDSLLWTVVLICSVVASIITLWLRSKFKNKDEEDNAERNVRKDGETDV